MHGVLSKRPTITLEVMLRRRSSVNAATHEKSKMDKSSHSVANPSRDRLPRDISRAQGETCGGGKAQTKQKQNLLVCAVY